jgi:hypothetical protein
VAKEAAANGSRHVCLFFLSSATYPAGGRIATFFPFRSCLRDTPGRARAGAARPYTVEHHPLDLVRVTSLQIGLSRHQGRQSPPGADSVANPTVQAGREILIAEKSLGPERPIRIVPDYGCELAHRNYGQEPWLADTGQARVA